MPHNSGLPANKRNKGALKGAGAAKKKGMRKGAKKAVKKAKRGY
jgi:hypothetical protein